MLIKRLFSSAEKLKVFEIYFNIGLKKTISKFIFVLTKYIHYEKDIKEDYDGNYKFSKESLSTINQFFKSGVDLAYFADNLVINDFTVNNCDSSQFSIAFLNNGHKRVNVINTFITKKRSDDCFKMLESENLNTNFEDAYKQSLEINFTYRVETFIASKYSEIGYLLMDNYINQRKNDPFAFKKTLPPTLFDDIQSDFYNDVTNT